MTIGSEIEKRLPKVPKNPVTSVATVPASVTGYAIDGEEGIESIENGIRARAGDGKFSKFEAAYSPQTPLPPGAWEYKCATCRFYDKNGSGESRCEVVGNPDDPFGGEKVHPEAWCGLWLPVDGQGWFDWIRNRIEGDSVR